VTDTVDYDEVEAMIRDALNEIRSELIEVVRDLRDEIRRGGEPTTPPPEGGT
jgi:hypothetical protein